MYKPWLTSTQIHTILGGYLGSILFVLSLTALGNLETYIFGKAFQVKLFPEGKVSVSTQFLVYVSLLFYISVLFCLVFSLFSSAMIHRVCATTS